MSPAASPIQNVSPLGGYAPGGGQQGGGNGSAGRAAADQAATGVKDSLELSPEARRELEKLQARDRQVRAHEAAHMAAGGGLVRGGASYSTQKGPDGQLYATGGEVSIDTSPVANNPRATLAKAQQIQAAALAPADPSAQDRKVAADAARMAAQAGMELAKGSGAAAGKAQGSTGLKLDITA